MCVYIYICIYFVHMCVYFHALCIHVYLYKYVYVCVNV